jgi:hypothetical protein
MLHIKRQLPNYSRLITRGLTYQHYANTELPKKEIEIQTNPTAQTKKSFRLLEGCPVKLGRARPRAGCHGELVHFVVSGEVT